LFEDEVNAHRRNGHEVLFLEGPPILLRPDAISTMALVIHELATNSAKYGALAAQGSVHVTLQPREDGGLDIRWREQGGPPVTPPTRRGFGSAIVERTVPFDLQGTAELRYVLSGLEADFYLPAKHVIIGTETSPAGDGIPDTAAKQMLPAARRDDVLSDQSILLLEDNLIIALETEDMLLALGAREVTVASTIAEAVAAATATRFDLAVLDINVAGQVSFGFAKQLKDGGVPYIFASGYGDQVPLDSERAGAIVLQKPFEIEHLRQAVLIQAEASPPAQSQP
jgi:CheY-like chemotaxis protein